MLSNTRLATISGILYNFVIYDKICWAIMMILLLEESYEYGCSQTSKGSVRLFVLKTGLIGRKYQSIGIMPPYFRAHLTKCH